MKDIPNLSVGTQCRTEHETELQILQTIEDSIFLRKTLYTKKQLTRSDFIQRLKHCVMALEALELKDGRQNRKD